MPALTLPDVVDAGVEQTDQDDAVKVMEVSRT